MAYDGIQYSARVDTTTERKLHAKVVDQILSAPTYFSRILGMGKPFLGKTEDVTVDITSDAQGEFFTALETFNSSAVSTTISLSYAHTAFTQPKVSIMMESFANAGQTGTIPLDAFKYSKAAAETLQRYGSTIYADGTANRPNGLGNIVAASGSIGGQARSTYTALNATSTSWSTALTLAKMATLHDAISAASLADEEPNIGVTTKTVWSLYEQLLTPNVRADYAQVGYPALAVRGINVSRNKAELRNGAGFNALSYRGMPIIKDDFATSGYMYFLNENYFDWMGRTIVPDEYKEVLEKVSLGSAKGYEGTGAMALEMPSDYNGFFYQKPLMLPNQAGMIARFYVIGQTVAKGFRRLGVGTGASTV